MSQTLKLRPYQRESIDAVQEAWADGMQRPAVVLPTGAGKTVVFSRMAAEHIASEGTRVVILVHRDELADQTLSKLKQTEPGLFVGKVKAADDNIAADVMVCSVQTLARETRFNRLVDSQEKCGKVGLVIVDECFPAGTLAGGSPIESLKVGDTVPTWNEDTGREEVRPVRRVMRKRPSAMVRVTLADGTSFACTPNHPILTTWGWCPAGMLWKDAHVVSFGSAAGSDLHRVRDAGDLDSEGPQGFVPAERSDVLLGRLSGRLGEPGRFGADGADEPRARLGTHDGTQPDAPAGGAGEDVRHTEAHWAQAEAAWRERFGSDRAAADACGVPGLGDRGRDSSEGRRAALALPSGHRASDDEGRRGGGRGVPLLAGPPNLRPEKGRTAVGTRVAGVEVLEPGRDGTYGGVCPDGYVYNIEVDATHTYLIGDGVVVHNCHHAAAVSYRNILAGLGCYSGMPGTRAVGFTATLARGDGQGLGDVWEDAVYTRSPLWMMSRGHLVDVKSKLIDVDTLHLGDVKRSKGDYQAKDLGDAMMEAGGPQIIAKVLQEHAADRRSPIIFTPTVEVARATAEALPDAAYVHGGTPREERLSIYRKYRTGEVRTLVNCMVLTEGFDAPWADCAIIARPTKSEPLFCLDDLTEILTDQGWKGVDDDLADALPAAYDLTDGSVHWSPLLARVERPLGVDEEMFALSSPTADIRVSDRHRMVWRSRNDATWRVSEARDLASRRTEYRIPIAGVQKAPGVPLTDDELRFVGWFMTDGTLNRGTKHIAILQAEHQPWNADIRACLKGCGFKYNVYRSEHPTQYNRTSATLAYGVSYGKPRGTDKHLRGWADLELYLSKDLAPALEGLTRDQLAVLLHAMHLGDGSKQVNQAWTRRSYHISTGNKVMADRLQSLCVRRGFKCNVAVHTYNANPLYVLHIKDTAVKAVGGCGRDDRQSLGRDETRPGELVWCVETDAGTIITRRNGKVSILGNCQMVGRVLRPSPATGKSDALVLILAGEGGSLCTLVDLEPGFEGAVKDGESLAEAYEREESRKDTPVPAGSLRFELKHRDIDLFKASAAYSWLRTQGGVQFIPLGDNGEIVLWPSKEPEKWDVAFAPKRGTWERLHTGLDLGLAMAWAETEATDRSSLNMTRTASWRKKPASPKMVGLLKYAGHTVPDGLRAGLASDLFAVTVASRKLDRFLPSA